MKEWRKVQLLTNNSKLPCAINAINVYINVCYFGLSQHSHYGDTTCFTTVTKGYVLNGTSGAALQAVCSCTQAAPGKALALICQRKAGIARRTGCRLQQGKCMCTEDGKGVIVAS